jgi:hypothetical protein
MGLSNTKAGPMACFRHGPMQVTAQSAIAAPLAIHIHSQRAMATGTWMTFLSPYPCRWHLRVDALTDFQTITLEEDFDLPSR